MNDLNAGRRTSIRAVAALVLTTGALMSGRALAQAPVPITKGSQTPESLAAAAAKRLAAATAAASAPAGPANAPAPAPQAAAVQPRAILVSRPVDSDHPVEAGNFQSESMNEQATHITVGHSLFIDTKKRLARVYITNPEILDSYTASPNQVVLTAKKAGMSTLILWDEAGESRSYLVSSDMNVEQLRESLALALPSEKIKAQGNEEKIVLSGTVGSKAAADAAVKLASGYTKEVSNSMVVNTAWAKQVRLEVKVVEVDRSKLSAFGFNFFSAGGQNTATTSTNQYPSTMTVTPATPSTPKTVAVGNPLNFSLYSSRLNIGATLQDLETLQVAQILAEPNITTMSGEKANFLAGGEFPFPVVQSSSTGAPVISLMFKPYGVKIEFLPIVNDDGTIDLKVAPEVSALDYVNAVNISGYTIPAISSRRADTEVVLKNGQTFAIAGLLDKRTTDLYSKTPGVASVPILGQLFKSKNVNHSDSELMVMVTPYVVDPISDPATTPSEMERPIPLLNRGTFDKQLPSGAKK